MPKSNINNVSKVKLFNNHHFWTSKYLKGARTKKKKYLKGAVLSNFGF